MDAIDLKVLEVLMAQGRITWAELASTLGLSAPATAERVRQLESKGVITQYTAVVNPEKIDLTLMAFISVSLTHPTQRAAFLEEIAQLPEIQECHHVAGDDDYLLKVRVRNTAHLDWLVSDRLKGAIGVSRTRTTIVLSTAKETTALPLPSHGSGAGSAKEDRS